MKLPHFLKSKARKKAEELAREWEQFDHMERNRGYISTDELSAWEVELHMRAK